MSEQETKMDFSDYYNLIKELRGELVSEVCKRLDISERTLYNRLSDKLWSQAELNELSKIMDEFNYRVSCK